MEISISSKQVDINIIIEITKLTQKNKALANSKEAEPEDTNGELALDYEALGADLVASGFVSPELINAGFLKMKEGQQLLHMFKSLTAKYVCGKAKNGSAASAAAKP